MNVYYYDYDETFAECNQCGSTMYALAMYYTDEDGRQWSDDLLYVCPQCDKELHLALLDIFSKLRRCSE